MLEFTFDEFARVEFFAVDTARPVAGREEAHHVEFAGLKRFEPGRVVFVYLDQHAVEIGRAAPYVQVLAPVVRVAHVGDVFAETHRPDFVGAAADRNVHHHLIKSLGLAAFHAPFATEHWQATHGQWQFAVGPFEVVTHRALVDDFNAGDVFQHGFISR